MKIPFSRVVNDYITEARALRVKETATAKPAETKRKK